MNICFISREYPPEQSFGGIGTHVYNLSHGMAENGHDVDVICLTERNERTYTDHGVRVHRTRPIDIRSRLPEYRFSRLGSALNRWGYSLAFWKKLEELARQRTIDLLDTGELFSDAFFNGVTERFPQIVRLYTPLFWLADNGFHGIEWNAETEILAELETFCSLRSQKITSPSANLARIVANRWGVPLHDIDIVPNPVDTTLFSPAADGIGRGGDGPVVLFVGRLDKRKGVESLLRAIPSVAGRIEKARFRIIGSLNPYDHSYDAEFASLMLDLQRSGLDDRVERVDRADHFSMPAHYQAADLCVVPSLYDNSPNTAIEAMSCGKPVVGTRVGGIPEYVPDGVCGSLVAPGNPFELANAVIALLQDDALRATMGRNARERALRLYDRRVVARRTERLYHQVLERFGKGERVETLRMLLSTGAGTTTLRDPAPIPPIRAASQGIEANPLVSVIMVNYNCGAFLDLIFPSLFGQRYENFEVIVVDNGSTDGSVDRIRNEYSSARVIELGVNTGFSHANNVGIREAKGELILTVNFDVALENDFIGELVSAIQTDERVGWAAGYVLKLATYGLTGEIDCSGHYMTRSRYAHGFDLSKPFRRADYFSPAYVFGASACAALYRRAMLEDIAVDGEVFDEDFFAYFEDVDLDWRAQQRGWKCRYTPLALGYHMRGGTGLIKRPEVAALELSNRFLMMIKNDTGSLLLRDLLHVFKRTIRDVLENLEKNPRAVPIAVARVARYAPKMWKKRRIIRGRAVASSGHLRTFIR
ncbi:MAG: glycosyltransferase [Candidatus Methylomirabilis oxyfera]|nr:glycosyltransferase [Candidatus Methylomirabilis oxyfera]